MPKQPSRPQRWASAAADARLALDALDAAKADVKSALDNLADIQQEYADWADNLPENLQGSALSEKLDEVNNIDFDWDESDLDAASEAVDAAEGADLPLGFGRD